jgi:hypothetical protein
VGTLDAEFFLAVGGGAIAKVAALAPTVTGKVVRAGDPLLLPPADMRVRFVAKSPEGSVIDDWLDTITVPDFVGAPLSMSTPRVFRTRSFAEWKALQAETDPQPSPTWQFRRTERALVSVECYARGGEPTAEAHILSREGKELTVLPLPAAQDGRLRFELPVSSFGQGIYLLRLRLHLAGQTAEQVTAFRIIQ